MVDLNCVVSFLEELDELQRRKYEVRLWILDINWFFYISWTVYVQHGFSILCMYAHQKLMNKNGN